MIAAVSLYGGTAAVSTKDVRPPPAGAIAAIERMIGTSLTKREDALIVNTHSQIVEQCMEERGYRIYLGRLRATDIGVPRAYKTRLEAWLFDDVRQARRDGYGISGTLRDASRPKRRSRPMRLGLRDMTQHERQRYDRAYFGSPRERVGITELDGGDVSMPGGGCMGEATRSLWGNLKRYLIFLDARGTADDQLWLSTTGRPEVENALEQWRICLQGGGFKAADPHAATLRAAQAVMAGGVSRGWEERERAVLDARCKRSTDLADRFARAYVVNGRIVLRTLGDILLRFKEIEARALRRARRLSDSLTAVPRRPGL